MNKRVADCKIGSPFFKYGFTEAGIHYNICVGMPSPWGRCPWPRPRMDEGKPSENFPQMGFDRKVYQPLLQKICKQSTSSVGFVIENIMVRRVRQDDSEEIIYEWRQ